MGILPVTILALVLQGWTPDPADEIRFWSLVHGVNPNLALAVQDVESGGAPEHRRDIVVSQGNYGRFQVRCATWRSYFGLRDCADLLDRHRNIRLGIRIVRLFQDRFASVDGRGCRCGTHADHHWIAHYNEGEVVVAGGKGEAYGRLVASRVHQGAGQNRKSLGLGQVVAAHFSAFLSGLRLSSLSTRIGQRPPEITEKRPCALRE